MLLTATKKMINFPGYGSEAIYIGQEGPNSVKFKKKTTKK